MHSICFERIFPVDCCDVCISFVTALYCDCFWQKYVHCLAGLVCFVLHEDDTHSTVSADYFSGDL